MAAINLLEEFGFKDDTRRKLDLYDPPKKPEKPTADNVMDDNIWGPYVTSLSGLPPLGNDLSTVGSALANAVTSSAAAQLDKLKFWQGALERKTWGEGKDGQILFASGATDTYALNNANFERVTTLDPTVTSLSYASDGLSGREKFSIAGFVLKLQNVLRTY